MSLDGNMQSLVTRIATEFNTVRSEIGAGGGGPSTPAADTLLLDDLERRGRIQAEQSATRAIIEYEDTKLFTERWDTLSHTMQANHTVSGNRLYGTALTGGGLNLPLPRNITPGERFIFYTDITLTTKLASSSIFVGMSTRAYNSVAALGTFADEFLGGMGGATGSVTWNPIKGSNLSAVTTPVSYSMALISGAPSEFPAGKYQIVISGDENGVCFSFRHVTDSSVALVQFWSTTQFAAAGKTFGKLSFIVNDNRGVAGHSIGPVIGTIGSLQPPRMKTLAGQQQVGIAHVERFAFRPSNFPVDRWMWSLPKNYDPRRPTPLVVRITGANSSVALPNRFWTLQYERAVTTALLDAGYIVVGANDGYEVGTGMASNRFANDESMLNHQELIAWLRDRYNIGPVILNGYSMGGQASLRLIGQRKVPNIAAAWLMAPGTDWSETAGVDPSYKPHVKTALGNSSMTDAEMYTILTNPANPISSMVRPATDFRGVPVRVVVASDDTITPPAIQTDPFLAKITGYNTEASKKTIGSGTGGHTSQNIYDGADFISFLAPYIDMDNTAADTPTWVEPYSDNNPPQTLNFTEFATTSVPTPPAGQATLSTETGASLVLTDDAGNKTTFTAPSPLATAVTNASANTDYSDNSTYFKYVTTGDGFPFNGMLTGIRVGTTHTQRLQDAAAGQTHARYWINGSTAWSSWIIYLDAQDYDAKGDMLVGTGADTYVRVPVGTDGQILIADSTQAAGMKYRGESLESFPFTKTGALTVAAGTTRLPIAGGTFSVSSVAAMVGTAPTGASVIVDVNKNGTTIFTTQGNRPTIAVSTTAATVGAWTATTVTTGDYLTVDIDQIGSTIAGSDLTVVIRLQRTA